MGGVQWELRWWATASPGCTPMLCQALGSCGIDSFCAHPPCPPPSPGPFLLLQAAAAMAELASRNAGDPDFESPYTQEALQEGIDLPIWEKLMGASFKVGVAEGREVPANQQIWSSVRTPGKGQPACIQSVPQLAPSAPRTPAGRQVCAGQAAGRQDGRHHSARRLRDRGAGGGGIG